MRFHAAPRRLACALFIFHAIILSVPARAHAAVNPVDLGNLRQLFAKDPATAFEKSWKMFQEPRKKGDLEGMMGMMGIIAFDHPMSYSVAELEAWRQKP